MMRWLCTSSISSPTTYLPSQLTNLPTQHTTHPPISYLLPTSELYSVPTYVVRYLLTYLAQARQVSGHAKNKARLHKYLTRWEAATCIIDFIDSFIPLSVSSTHRLHPCRDVTPRPCFFLIKKPLPRAISRRWLVYARRAAKAGR